MKLPRAPSSIVVLTGAGISAESGVATFRDPDGIWATVDYRDVATPEGFARNPDLVHEFYNARRGKMSDYKPNAAHIALAEFESKFPALLPWSPKMSTICTNGAVPRT